MCRRHFDDDNNTPHRRRRTRGHHQQRPAARGIGLNSKYGAAEWPSYSPWPEGKFGHRGGWTWYGFGNVNENTRYWMITLAQPRAHCFPLGKP
jgi:hypothetical protein